MTEEEWEAIERDKPEITSAGEDPANIGQSGGAFVSTFMNVFLGFRVGSYTAVG